MARPRSEFSTAAIEALREREQTARELCYALDLPERTVKDICYRLVSAGVVCVTRKVRHAHARRPVACYGIPDSPRNWMMPLWR